MVTPSGAREIDVVAIAKVQLQGVALHLSPVTNTLDLKLFLETLGDALNHVGNHGAGHAPLLTRALGFTARLNFHHVVLNSEGDVVGCGEGLGAFRALHFDGLAGDRLAETPLGRSTGFLPIRDIVHRPP